MPKLASTIPKGLKASAETWSQITGTYQLRPDELRILEDACRESDLIDRMQSVVDSTTDDGMTVKGSQGQPVAHPLLSEIRQHRQVHKALMAALKLPDDEADSGANAGRALANARWRRSS